MTDNTPSPAIEQALRRLYGGEPDPLFADLLRRRLVAEAASQIPATRRMRSPFRPAWVIAIFVTLALIGSVLWIGPARVMAAVRGLLGFIPGLGFVSDVESAQVLATPVSQTSDTARLTIVDAVADAESTRIRLEAEGVGVHCEKTSGTIDRLVGPRGLTLPDGSQVSMKGWKWTCNRHPYEIELIYQPLPTGVSEATLAFDVAPGSPTDLTVQTWKLPLIFQPAPLSARVGAAASVETAGEEADGVRLTLESVAQTANYTALRVRITYAGPGEISNPGWGTNLEVRDDGGNHFEILETPSFEANNTVATLHVGPLEPGKRYTLRLNGPIEIAQPVPEIDISAQFVIDLGENPKIGDDFELDQVIQAAGYELHPESVILWPGEKGVVAMMVKFASCPEITGVMLFPAGDTSSVLSSSWGGQFMPDGTLPLNPTMEFLEMPRGELHLRVASVFRSVGTRWELSWQMPMASPTP